ncbi:MAG TPA: formate dehydrogenase accessory sulfurtransferase FdhD [bacterium]
MLKPPRTMALTTVSEWNGAETGQVQDYLAGEEPLQIRVNGAPLAVTMRTPGAHDLELAAGWLLTEGAIHSGDDILAIRYADNCKPTEQGNVVDVTLPPSIAEELAGTRRTFDATSACGVCGKGSIDAIRVGGARRLEPGFSVSQKLLLALPDRLRAAQNVFGRTGGLHGAGLFTARGELIVLREDIGRHNAVDKVVGWALLQDRLPLNDTVLLVSGRGGFEIVQKAIVARIPVLASVSAPSSLAVQLARELGLTLVGFLRDERFVVYAGEERIAPAVGDGSR